ncbi:hypothetical protein ACLB2K_025453 [Fragaria x ananassa]
MIIGYTIRDYIEYEASAKKAGKLIIRVENSLYKQPLPFKCWKILKSVADGAVAITSQQKSREEEEAVLISPKKLRLNLAVGKRHMHLSPNRLRFVSLALGEQRKKKRGRIVGSKNKQA